MESPVWNAIHDLSRIEKWKNRLYDEIIRIKKEYSEAEAESEAALESIRPFAHLIGDEERLVYEGIVIGKHANSENLYIERAITPFDLDRRVDEEREAKAKEEAEKPDEPDLSGYPPLKWIRAMNGEMTAAISTGGDGHLVAEYVASLVDSGYSWDQLKKFGITEEAARQCVRYTTENTPISLAEAAGSVS